MVRKESPKKPSIKDIAAATGFSSAAVSYVLSRSGRVSTETRDVMLKAANRMEFTRDANAVRLRSGRSNLFGVIINDVSNPFFAELLADFEDQAYELGYVTIVANSKDDPERQSVLLKSLAAQGAAGLLISPAHGTVASTFDQMLNCGNIA
jgi:DNA-binding LacI/PurR family transcriptional regulator